MHKLQDKLNKTFFFFGYYKSNYEIPFDQLISVDICVYVNNLN